MDVERGLWRAVLVLSVLGAALSPVIIFTSPQMRLYRAYYYAEPLGGLFFCLSKLAEWQATGSVLPELEQKAQEERAKLTLSPGERNALSKLETEIAKLAREFRAGPNLPDFCTRKRMWWEALVGERPPWVFVLAGSVLAGAVPWVMWYPLRWIVRGFLTSTKAN